MKISFEGPLDEILQECSAFVARFSSVGNAAVSETVERVSATQPTEEKKGRGRTPKTSEASATVEAKTEAPAPAPAPVDDLFGSDPTPTPVLTPEDFKKALQESVTKHGVETIRKKLGEYGVAKAGDLPQDKWAEFLKKVA